jgi:uncharacterized membrane protein
MTGARRSLNHDLRLKTASSTFWIDCDLPYIRAHNLVDMMQFSTGGREVILRGGAGHGGSGGGNGKGGGGGFGPGYGGCSTFLRMIAS